MASVKSRTSPQAIDYPTSDGRPMAETDDHRDLMLDLIGTLKLHRRTARRFYISGNLLIFYEEGNRHRHVAPDVFVVRGVSKRRRRHYLLWVEGKSPNAAIELTSKSTRKEDLKNKFILYRDRLKIGEYFLFDPHQEYLRPHLQGYRLISGEYVPIEPIAGRLPCEELGLHLEADGWQLRFYDPKTGKRLPTLGEAREQEAAARRSAEAATVRLEEENEQLRKEVEALRRRLTKEP
jgi:Uma2 family endonuclease